MVPSLGEGVLVCTLNLKSSGADIGGTRNGARMFLSSLIEDIMFNLSIGGFWDRGGFTPACCRWI